MHLEPEEKDFVQKVRDHFDECGGIGTETSPDGSAEIAPGYRVTEKRLKELMEYAL